MLPTRKARSLFETGLRLLEKVPLFREAMAPQQEINWSDVPLTIIIPLHPKDAWIAPYALKYARKNLRHPISEIVIVSQSDDEILNWVKQENLRWVDENKVLSQSKEDVVRRLPEHASSRGGWVFQQLLKFAVEDLIDTEAFLILDADTVLLTPRVFKKDDTLWIDYSHERNMLYLKAYRNLLGERAGFLVSFVCHHMFGEKRVLRELKGQIERETGQPWVDAIIDLAKSEVWSEKEKRTRPFNYFSEYETYGNFIQKFYEDIRPRYFRNHAAKEYDPSVMSPDQYIRALPKFFRWASFHSYHGYKKTENGSKAPSSDEA